MAQEYKNLVQTQITNAMALLGTVVPASTTWHVRGLTLYNTSAVNTNEVEIRWGTSAAGKARYKYTLDPEESIDIVFKYAWPLEATQGIYGSATNTNEVNIFVDGMEET